MIQTLTNIAAHLAKNTEEMPVIYIAGRVTGLPPNEAYTKFRAKQLELEEMGFYVLNPMEHVPDGETWGNAMRICVVLLAAAGSVWLLDNWKDSPGAKLEHALALKLGIATVED
jgi:hypothetical protein